MTAATADVDTPMKEGTKISLGVAASTKVYKGTLGKVVSGYLTSITKAASLVFAGVIADGVDNSSGSAGAKNAPVYKKGLFEFAMSGAAVTDIGTEVYALDNATVTKTSTDATKVGKIQAVTTTGKVWISIDGYC